MKLQTLRNANPVIADLLRHLEAQGLVIQQYNSNPRLANVALFGTNRAKRQQVKRLLSERAELFVGISATDRPEPLQWLKIDLGRETPTEIVNASPHRTPELQRAVRDFKMSWWGKKWPDF